MEEFQEKYGGQLSLQDVRSDARKVRLLVVMVALLLINLLDLMDVKDDFMMFQVLLLTVNVGP